MTILRALFLFMIIGLTACGGDASNEGDNTDSGVENVTQVPSTPDMSNTTPPPTAEPAQNAEGVWHYTCPNGCEGGSGSAVACSNCGTMLVHNKAYHSNGVQDAQINMQDPQINMGQQTPPPTPEPAQNASGVWHYTCPNGCDGGAGSASACANCGTQLVHNKSYHQ